MKGMQRRKEVSWGGEKKKGCGKQKSAAHEIPRGEKLWGKKKLREKEETIVEVGGSKRVMARSSFAHQGKLYRFDGKGKGNIGGEKRRKGLNVGKGTGKKTNLENVWEKSSTERGLVLWDGAIIWGGRKNQYTQEKKRKPDRERGGKGLMLGVRKQLRGGGL